MIRKYLHKFFRWVNDYNAPAEEEVFPSMVSHYDDQIRSRYISFRLYAANGGTVIETSQYDPKKDDHNHSLYVINEGDGFHEALSQIVTMERLKC